MKKIAIFILVLFVSGSFAEELFPHIGRVKNSRLNVRSSASEDSEVLVQLNRGDLVTVLGEENGWLKIEPPKGSTFFIHTKMLKDGWVREDGVNVRSGPGTHYSVVCKVDKNASIDVVEKNGDWARILPPLNSAAWVSKEYIRFFATPQNYLVKLEEERESDEKFRLAEEFRAEELKKGMKEIDFDALIAKYAEIVEKYPDTKEFEKAQARLADAQAKQKVALREIEAAEMRAKRAAVRVPEPQRETPKEETVVAAPAPKAVVIREDMPQEGLISFVGRLHPARRASDAPFTHQLQGGFLGTERICLVLPATGLNLGPFHGKKVRVWGREVAGESSKTAAIRAEKIEIVR